MTTRSNQLRICGIAGAATILGCSTSRVRQLDGVLAPALIGSATRPMRVYVVEAVERLAAQRDAARKAR